MAEGKERLADYKADKADGQVNWAAQGKDAIKDWTGHKPAQVQEVVSRPGLDL